MRSLQGSEINEVSGGNVVNDLTSFLSDGLTHAEKTLAIASLSTGLVAGSFVPFASLIGIGAFAAWAVYDMTGGLSFLSGGEESEG